MTEIYFYQLTRSSLEQTVFDLCSKGLANGWRSVIVAPSKPVLDRLDAALWTIGGDESFLPHGVQSGSGDADQPILLSETMSQDNHADVALLASGADLDLDKAQVFKRLCVVFNGSEPSELTQARSDWKRVVAANLSAKYWSQDSGSWKMAAQSG